MSETLTLGEKLVRTKFNPSSDSVVDEIKGRSAALINLVNQFEESDDRSTLLAINYFETACMYAVKAATASK